MARTRAVPRRRPNINPNPRPRPDVDFQAQRVAATKERVKDVEVKHNGNVVRKMKVRRVAKHATKKRNVRYG